MDFIFLDIVLKLIKIMTSPHLPQYSKEKEIKDLVSKSIDIQPNFGPNTKNALKVLVNASPNEMAMADSIFGYLLGDINGNY